MHGHNKRPERYGWEATAHVSANAVDGLSLMLRALAREFDRKYLASVGVPVHYETGQWPKGYASLRIETAGEDEGEAQLTSVNPPETETVATENTLLAVEIDDDLNQAVMLLSEEELQDKLFLFATLLRLGSERTGASKRAAADYVLGFLKPGKPGEPRFP